MYFTILNKYRLKLKMHCPAQQYKYAEANLNFEANLNYCIFTPGKSYTTSSC